MTGLYNSRGGGRHLRPRDHAILTILYGTPIATPEGMYRLERANYERIERCRHFRRRPTMTPTPHRITETSTVNLPTLRWRCEDCGTRIGRHEPTLPRTLSGLEAEQLDDTKGPDGP